MNNPLISLAKILLPIAFIYLAYTFLGTIGGIAAISIYFVVMLLLNRHVIYQNRAGRKYQTGDLKGALEDLKKAMSYAPNNGKIRGSYAYLLLKTGNTDEAAVQIEEAIEKAQLEADKNTLKITRAMILWKQNRLDDAISELSELIKVFETTNVYASLGFFYILKGDLEKALDFNLKAKDYNSSNAIILDNLGSTYYLLGDYEKALETYQDVMKLKPSFPEAYYNYSRVLDKTGDLEKALYMARHSLTLPFWNISTVTKEEVESHLAMLEEKEKSMQAEEKESDNLLENNNSKTIEE